MKILITILLSSSLTVSFASDTISLASKSEAAHFLTTLQSLVRHQKINTISKAIDYPVTVHGCQKNWTINTPQQFSKTYHHSFNSDVTKAILNQKSNELFYNDQGMMIGNGQIWFDKNPHGKIMIITINHTDCTQYNQGSHHE